MLRIRMRGCYLLLLAGVLSACATTSGTPAAASSVRAAVVPLASAPDQFFTSDGARLRYRVIGSGEPVLFVHGATRTLEEWSGPADSLAMNHRVIAVDLRGHGQSTKFTDPTDFGARMAEDMVRLLDHLKIQRAHFVGHSMGALIASAIAARHPDRIATASLIAGPFVADSATLTNMLASTVADAERGDGFTNFFKWIIPGMPEAEAKKYSEMTLAANHLPSIVGMFKSAGAMVVPRGTSIRVPALVAVGGKDPLAPQSRELVTWWPGATLVEVPEANHFDIMAQPQVLAAMKQLIDSNRVTR